MVGGQSDQNRQSKVQSRLLPVNSETENSELLLYASLSVSTSHLRRRPLGSVMHLTVSSEEGFSAATISIASGRGLSLLQFNAETVATVIREHKRQRALQNIEEEVVGSGAEVSREVFEEAHHRMRCQS